ncbi:hypothetical protein ACTFIT_007185 [Dictyostelium discoideum]
MEINLLNWLLLKGKEDWILEYVKSLSDNNLHITLKSLYFHCISEIDLISFDKKYRNLLLKDIEPIYLKYNKNSQEFIYGCENCLIKNKIKEINQIKENQNLFIKPLITCLEIIKNNKRLLIKKENINLIFNQQSGELFLNQIWRSDSIKNEIINYLSIFKYHRFKMTFTSIKQIQKYKFKDYLDHVELSLSNSSSNIDGESINDYLEFQLPNSIRKLQINCNYIDNNNILQTNDYIEYIRPSSIPPSVTYLDFSSSSIGSCTNYHDNQIILNNKQTLPTTTTHLNYDTNFINQRNFFQESITILKLGNTQFTYSNEKIKIGVLPSQLIELDLGGYYNEIEENVLPPTLKSLTLCQSYNKTIKLGCLPSSLEYLSFHGDSNAIIKDHSDTKKGWWSFWSYFSNQLKESPHPQPVLIVGSLPISLKTLKLSSHQSFLDILISEVVSISHKSLTKLSIIQESKMFDYKTKKELSDSDAILKFNNWKHLNFKLPPSVKIIKLNTNRYFQFLENDSLPFTHFKTNSTWAIKTLPNTLKSISLKSQFDPFTNKNRITNYPDSLETLVIGSIADIPSIDSIPSSLIRLDLLYDSSFIPNFNHNLLKCSKLVTLKILSLPSTFTKELNIDLEFPNLEILFVGSSNPKIIISQPLKSLKLKKIIIKNNNYNFIDNNLQFYSLFKVYNSDIKKNFYKLIL